MSASTFSERDIFYASSLKHISTTPDTKWVNTYVIEANRDGSSADFQGIADAIHTSESAVLYNLYTFDRVRFSTYAEDSDPYNGDEFANVEYNIVGSRPISGEPAALSVTAYMRKTVNTGFNGKLELRGSLSEADIVAVNGKWAAANTAALTTLFNNSFEPLNDYINNGDNPFKMIVATAVGISVPQRRVTSVLYNKVSERKLARARKRLANN